MTLTSFSSPFYPAPALYSGTGVSNDVPARYHCALSGRPYLIDRKAEHIWGFEPRVRDSVDQSALPGEAAISPQGLWRRAQSTWHLGAGQDWADDDETLPGRFSSSKGIDVWTKGQMSLLPDTAQVRATTETNLTCVSSGSRFYVADGQTVRYTASVTSPSFTTVTGTAAANVTDLASDGTYIYIGQGASGIYRSSVSASTASSYVTGTVDRVGYVKGRLMAASGASLYNPTATGALPTALFTHANSGWVWTGFAAGQNHIFASGYAGSTSMVYRIAIVADGTALSSPVVALELPRGEVVRSIHGYLGFILLGTNRGVRFGQADDNGNLVVGAVIETSASVYAFASNGRYTYFGWTNFDGVSTGLGRLDLAQLTSPSTPAYASDLMVTGQETVQCAEIHDGRVVFGVSGRGFYTAASMLVASGHLDTGVFTYGVPDTKVLAKVDVVTEPLVGTVEAYAQHDSTAWEMLGFATGSDARHVFTAQQRKSYQIGLRFVLERSTTDATTGPTVSRWTARTFVSPSRSQVLSVPLLLHPFLTLRDGTDVAIDVDTELEALRDLIVSPRAVSYQELTRSVTVLVEDVRFVPVLDREFEQWAGTAIVTMRTLED